MESSVERGFSIAAQLRQYQVCRKVYNGDRLSQDSLLRLWNVRGFQQTLSDTAGNVRCLTVFLGHAVLSVVCQVLQQLLRWLQIVLLGFVQDPCLQVLDETRYVSTSLAEQRYATIKP
jgi:hypothetical protein